MDGCALCCAWSSLTKGSQLDNNFVYLSGILLRNHRRNDQSIYQFYNPVCKLIAIFITRQCLCFYLRSRKLRTGEQSLSWLQAAHRGQICIPRVPQFRVAHGVFVLLRVQRVSGRKLQDLLRQRWQAVLQERLFQVSCIYCSLMHEHKNNVLLLHFTTSKYCNVWVMHAYYVCCL